MSQRTVPIPTATASDCARRTWTSLRDSSPVTQREPGNADAAVERDRDLVRHERPTRRDPSAPLLDLLATAESELVVGELGVDTRLAEPLEAATVLRVRVELPRDDASDAGCEERVDARRRRAVVRAGLERDVHRRAACLLSRRLERDDLGMRLALALVPALADDLVPGDDDGPDDRVRMGRPATALGELECAFEEPGSMALILRSQAREPYAAAGGASHAALVEHVAPRARLAGRVAPARVRVRGAVVARARGTDRHAALARRAGGRGRAQAECTVAHRSRPRGRRSRALGRAGSSTARRPRRWPARIRRRALRSRNGALPNSDTDEVAVVAGLLPRLQVQMPSSRIRSGLLATEAERWAEEVPARYVSAGRSFEQALLDVALDVYRTVDRAAAWLVNQDLHGGTCSARRASRGSSSTPSRSWASARSRRRAPAERGLESLALARRIRRARRSTASEPAAGASRTQPRLGVGRASRAGRRSVEAARRILAA